MEIDDWTGHADNLILCREVARQMLSHEGRAYAGVGLDDLVSEAIIVLHQNIAAKKFDLSRPLRPYVKGIVRNLLNNAQRKAKEYRFSMLDDSIRPLTVPEFSETTVKLLCRMRNELHDSPRLCRVLDVYERGGVKAADIIDALGMTENAANKSKERIVHAANAAVGAEIRDRISRFCNDPSKLLLDDALFVGRTKIEKTLSAVMAAKEVLLIATKASTVGDEDKALHYIPFQEMAMERIDSEMKADPLLFLANSWLKAGLSRNRCCYLMRISDVLVKREYAFSYLLDVSTCFVIATKLQSWEVTPVGLDLDGLKSKLIAAFPGCLETARLYLGEYLTRELLDLVRCEYSAPEILASLSNEYICKK